MSELINNRWQPNTKKYKALERKARFLGATRFGLSSRVNKKYFVQYDDRKINFGSRMSDFTIHGDKRRRDNYRSRHRGIKLMNGRPAYLDKKSPAFWSWNLLWM